MSNLFDDRFMPEPNSGCWLWIGHISQKGYGKFGREQAHRIAWQKLNGPVPDSLHVLHKCDVRSCVNPAHLFLGTHTDNMRDKTAKGRHHLKRRDHCKHGHNYTSSNLINLPDGSRGCRQCDAMKRHRYLARKKGTN